MGSYKIAIIPGDGIGPELTEATLKVLDVAKEKFGLEFDYIFLEAGDACFKKRGVALPEETVEAIKNAHVCLKGPVGETAADVIVKLRMMFDLYANIRPVKSYIGVPCLRDDIDFVIVRENTEDVYKGMEFMLDENTAVALRVITRKGCERIARKAFEIALSRNKKRNVTAVHKANVMRKTCGLFAEVCRKVAQEYPDISFNEQYVDAAAMRLIKEPQKYDVIVTTNMFGDILSDEAAQLVGGLGMAPGGNIGDNFAIFEPVHGAAPTRVGKHTANPCSMILASKMMLEWLGEKYNDKNCLEASKSIDIGVSEALRKGLTIPDFGGSLTTIEMGEAIADEIGKIKL
ncbi:MAG TPA: isocitrate/isopropylmalate dehydrogenase family protein [Candidatus Bathyarchaeota archaeon]|nr:isocitrate/isopropylmalate dehydrogenase family protein [Candidatus Bathyarchaeota archaeon]HEX69606.1 isocitrate/isopropylmalate dehydrogenase family protein [Candidatus Bathyarchaeota archaeon]